VGFGLPGGAGTLMPAIQTRIAYTIKPGGVVRDDRVETGSVVDNGITAPWRVSSSAVINFGAATKTQILSIAVTKDVDESDIEIACQIPFFGNDAIDIDVSFEAQQGGVAIQSSPSHRLKLDANGTTNLPWAYVEEFDALPAGAYDVKVFGTRFSGNTCSTDGTYKMSVREFKR
jgi:hypothetical protein